MSVDQLLLIATVATLGAIACAWQIRKAIRTVDHRTSNDQDAASLAACNASRPEPPEWGHDHQLYLDCIAVYGDCEELDRLRNAINEAREGEAS